MTRVDDGVSRRVSTQLGDLQFKKHSNGDFTIIGRYQPKPYNASKISRVLHKIAFEILCGYANEPDLCPMNPRFTPLRDFVRCPKNSNEFSPFAWKRRPAPQGAPRISTACDSNNDEFVADICEVQFPGISYLIAYPPWPTSSKLWASIQEANSDLKIVTTPGMTTLDPEEIQIPLIKVEGSKQQISAFSEEKREDV